MPSSGSSAAIRIIRRWWTYRPPPCPAPRSASRRRDASAPGEGEPSRRSDQQQRHPDPVALPLARATAERGEHEAVPRGDLAARGEELPQPLLLLRGERGAPPLDVFLERAETAKLARAPRQGLAAVPPRLTLGRSEKGELHRGHAGLEPVEPMMVHAGKECEEEAGQRHRRAHSDTQLAQG